MTGLLRLIWRFTVIVFGYGCAILAAALLLNALILATLGVLPDTVDDGFEAGLWIATPFMALLIGYFAFWPAVAMVVLGEYFTKRDSLFYALSGLVIAIILSVFGYQAGLQQEINDAQQPIILLSMAAAGVTGGFVYWLIAGCSAGCLSRKIVNQPETAD